MGRGVGKRWEKGSGKEPAGWKVCDRTGGMSAAAWMQRLLKCSLFSSSWLAGLTGDCCQPPQATLSCQ